MRELVISVRASALLAAGTVTGTTGVARGGAAHATIHVAAAPGRAIVRPGGGCSTCRI